MNSVSSKTVMPALKKSFSAPSALLLPGAQAQAGDMLLVGGRGFVSSGIRFIERLRKPRGSDKDTWKACCRYSHVAWLVEKDLVIQEAARGSSFASLASVLESASLVTAVRWDAHPSQHAAALEFLFSTVGSDYGFLTYPADLFNALTGLELSLGWNDHMVCSTQCFRAAERLGLIGGRNPWAVLPAHMALYAHLVA